MIAAEDLAIKGRKVKRIAIAPAGWFEGSVWAVSLGALTGELWAAKSVTKVSDGSARQPGRNRAQADWSASRILSRRSALGTVGCVVLTGFHLSSERLAGVWLPDPLAGCFFRDLKKVLIAIDLSNRGEVDSSATHSVKARVNELFSMR